MTSVFLASQFGPQDFEEKQELTVIYSSFLNL